MAGTENKLIDKDSDLFQWIELALKGENVDIAEVFSKGTSNVGDGYSGEILFIQVKARKDKKLVDYNLVIKKSVQDEKTRENLIIKQCYEREIYTYCTVLPEFIDFETRRGLKPFNYIPKCYGGYIFSTQEVLVFENLKIQGYKTHDTQKFMNKKHRELTLEAYSHWHALSLGLKDQNHELFEKLFKHLDNFSEKLLQIEDIKKLILGAQKLTSKILKERNELSLLNKWEEKVKGGFLKKFEELIEKAKKDVYSVFTHSDCWHSNFMFKYKDNDILNPSKVAVLDFQLASLNSLAFDLSYHLYYVTPTEEIPNIKDDLAFYYHHLSKRLVEFGSQHEIFPFSELVNEWNKYAILGAFMSLMWLPNSMSDHEDMLPSMENLSEDTTRVLVDGMKKDVREKIYDHMVAIVKHNVEDILLDF